MSEPGVLGRFMGLLLGDAARAWHRKRFEIGSQVHADLCASLASTIRRDAYDSDEEYQQAREECLHPEIRDDGFAGTLFSAPVYVKDGDPERCELVFDEEETPKAGAIARVRQTIATSKSSGKPFRLVLGYDVVSDLRHELLASEAPCFSADFLSRLLHVVNDDGFVGEIDGVALYECFADSIVVVAP